MIAALRPALLVLTGLLLFGTAPAHAQPAAGIVKVDASTQRVALDDKLLYLQDLEQSHTLNEVLKSAGDLPWRQKSALTDAPIMQGGLYWFRVTLVNTSDRDLNLLLQTEYPLINVADLYRVDSDDTISTIYADAGLEGRFDNRPIRHPSLLNNFQLAAGEQATFIWRIDSEPLLMFRTTLWDPETFAEWDFTVQLLQGMMYGTLLVMLLYNLFVYFSTWHKGYIFYVAYLATALYTLASQQGHLYQYIAPEQIWAKLPIHGLFYAVNTLVFGEFTIRFLDLRKRSRALMLAVRTLTLSAIVLTIAVLITSNIFVVATGFIAIGSLYLTALAAGVWVRKHGVISAGHFVIAIMILSLSVIISNMATVGLIESNGLTNNMMGIGITLMLVFFSLALADRINQLQKEVAQANRTVLKANEEKLKAEAELNNSKKQRIKLEQSFNRARMESRSKSDFIATLGHEIRTPMHGVLGMTQLLKETQLDSQQTHYLNTIEHSGQALLSIINDLQDFAKIEAGELELDFASFNLETVIDQCVSTFALRAVEKNINFIADLDPSIEPVLRGDATKLRQIILNLLSNAFKFTDSGDILLIVRATDKPSINSVELKFEVQDSGIGLTEDEQQRLFTPFQHVDENTYGRYGGSGLGLAISKQLVELMDGQIGVDSEPGKGSRFWFTARFLVDEHPDPALVKHKDSKLSGQRVLLVDPSPVSADILCRLLTGWRMTVEHCANADDALAAAAREDFNIVLSEYNLDNNSDGVALARRLQRSGRSDARFILMAAGRHLKDRQELLDSGVELVLEKPVTNALLHDVLSRAAGGHTTGAEPEPVTTNTAATPEEQQLPRVLVVEDNQVNQMVITGLLKQLGVEADCVDDGLSALQRYDDNDYDLILMDCEMPEMNGYEATAQIRARERHNGRHRARIIALSAHARPDHRERATESGMDGYLTKPVTLSDLSAIVRGVD